MRIDRAGSLAIAAIHPHGVGNRIVVLMYHSISDRTETRSHPYYKTVTSPACFGQQMRWLAESGAEVVSLGMWNSPFSTAHSRRVILTFDDGFADFINYAFPVLRSYDYSATVFLPTAFIETGKELLPGVQHLTWAEARHLIASGFSIGSHTATHRHLETLSRREIDVEVRGSAEMIQKKCGCEVTAFSCPYAFPQTRPAVVSALRESLAEWGYTVSVTTRIGTVSVNDDPYTLKRLPINSNDDKKLFLAKLNGAYDWLNGIQRIVQSAKKIFRR